MQPKHILIAFIAGGLFAASCKKQLNLQDPQGLNPQAAVSSDGNVKRVLQGGYDAISSSSIYGGDLQIMADLEGSDGELSWKGTFNNYREIWGKNIITTNSLITNTWVRAYNAINIANTVLSGLQVVAAADKNRVQGEALFIRGALHFELVRLYAKNYTDGTAGSNPGVPLMKTPVNSIPEITKPVRSSVDAVYAAVIEDLLQAENLLPASNSIYATKSAAAAILSRVYLQKADYAGARDAANRAITNSGKSLLQVFMNNFNQSANTAEDIFTIQVSDQDGANNLQVFYSVDIFGGRDGDIEVNTKHLNLYDATDIRKSVTNNPTATTQYQFNTAFYLKYSAYRTTKFRDLYKNINVIRLAEMFLTRAEANYRLNTATGDSPLNDINRTRTRAGLAALTSITDLNQIYLERRKELAFEGFAIHDAKRFQRSIDGKAWNDSKLIFPIPFREINANSALTQNTGY